jgi:hypothetical protein
MQFKIGDTVRITRGDLRGRTGTIRRIPSGDNGSRASYGVEFSGESGVSSFRSTNLEPAPAHAALPEFMVADDVIHLLDKQPYELITGGLMGKRRRYRGTDQVGEPPYGMTDDDSSTCDFRRFPVEREGVVVAGLWSRFTPHTEHITEVLSRVDRVR